MPVAVFRRMQCVHYHMCVGSFRTNFSLSSFFITNSKRLSGRSTFVKSLFMHDMDKLYNNIGNEHAKQDCTLNRLTYLFLKDIRPFGIEPTELKIGYEFNFAAWVEVFSTFRGDKRDNNPFDLDKFAYQVLGARKKVKLAYSEAAQQYENDQKFHEMLYQYCKSLFDTMKCRMTSNFDYENVNNETFVSNINSLIKQIQRQSKHKIP